ncbi:uncharacterized protein LOC111404060 [Olea europaea var. sylvestris]|uniref:Uncharacterized protein n=1 Tax=Olea europaea subsp. europaea TaxID=158383 RepID=A0A8S0QWL8_OLEEU|nr:uncharacterized protein LOC111404060 [Olea europaea var. sylvestris]CAA2970506.1 Hypothetical predicted protein [Olea europaea subsp. europaea]
MGNCLVLQEKVIKVIKIDGKILEYKAPLEVHHVLSEFSHHAISDKLPVVQYMNPNAKMKGGQLYYLLPLPVASPRIKKKKTVRFADSVKEAGEATGVVRIKLVISKQDLQAMLRKGGVSVDDLVSKQSTHKVDTIDRIGNMNCRGWTPALDGVPEVN